MLYKLFYNTTPYQKTINHSVNIIATDSGDAQTQADTITNSETDPTDIVLISSLNITGNENITAPYEEGATYNSGCYCIEGKKIYVCNTTGAQTGTWANNSAYWDELVVAPLGVLPVLDGSNLTDVTVSAGNKLISNDTYKMLILTNSILQYYDGTRDRLDITTVHSKFYSPDGDYTLLDNSQFLYNDGIRNRLEINASGTMLVAPAGANTIIVDNTGAFYNGSEIITVGDVNISNWDTAYGWGDHSGTYSLLSHVHGAVESPDTLKTLTLTNTDLIYNDGTFNRVGVTSVTTILVSPDGSVNLQVSDTGVLYNDTEIATVDDIYTHPTGDGNLHVPANSTTNDGKVLTASAVAGTYTWETPITHGSDTIISPDTLKDLTLSNSNLLYSDGSYARLFIDSTESRLTSPGGQAMISVKDADFTFNDGTKDRIEVSATNTALRSSDGSYLYLLNGVLSYYDATRNRLVLAPTESKILSPDGAKSFKIDNTELSITGKTTITQDGNFLEHTTTVTGSMDGKGYMTWYQTNGTTRTAWFGFGSSGNYDFSLRNEKADHHINIQTTGTGTIVMSNLPTSASGLPSGGLWNSGGTVKVA